MAEDSNRKLRILVIEDDPATLALTLELLGLLGHWATGVRSAEAAIDRFLEGAFDLLFLDVDLPGLSGIELAEKLRSREPLPVIFASGGNALPSALAGDAVWLTKPYTIEQLSDALAQCEPPWLRSS